MPIEVVTGGKLWRERTATIERGANVAGRDGISLELDEAMRLAARSQSIVAAEHMQEVVSAHCACAVCRRELTRNGGASIGHRTTFSNLRVADSRLDSKCRCSARAGASDSFNPFATLLEERPHPNCCAFKPARAAILSCERAARFRQDGSPIETAPGHSSIKEQARNVGAQLAGHEYRTGGHYFYCNRLRKSRPERADAMVRCVVSVKWRLWHGRSANSIERLTSILP